MTEVLFGYLFMVFHLIFMPFSGLSGCRGEFAASEAARAKKNQVSAPMSPVDEGKGERDR